MRVAGHVQLGPLKENSLAKKGPWPKMQGAVFWPGPRFVPLQPSTRVRVRDGVQCSLAKTGPDVSYIFFRKLSHVKKNVITCEQSDLACKKNVLHPRTANPACGGSVAM